jgi:hypothetical protein
MSGHMFSLLQVFQFLKYFFIANGFSRRFGLNYPCQKKSQKKCHDCKYYFPNRDCFNYHKQKGQRKGKSICEQRFHCPKCYKVVYAREKPHDCALSKTADDGGVELLGEQ